MIAIEKYEEAKDIFGKLGDYKDSKKQYMDLDYPNIKSANIGDIINFGSYE